MAASSRIWMLLDCEGILGRMTSQFAEDPPRKSTPQWNTVLRSGEENSG
jgi:hypothetical protein